MVRKHRFVARVLSVALMAGFGVLKVCAQGTVPPSLQGSFLQPGYITSAGQTSDAAIVKVLANTRLKLGFGYDIAAKPQSIAGAKTLVLVLGASNKGLGAAGLSLEQDIERVKSVIAEAQKNGVRIISMHTGGTARRGESSNQVIALCVPVSSVVVVVEGGNNDGFFSDLCEKAGVPLIQVASISEAGNVLKSLMAQQ